jgi:hypothetical protein
VTAKIAEWVMWLILGGYKEKMTDFGGCCVQQSLCRSRSSVGSQAMQAYEFACQ